MKKLIIVAMMGLLLTGCGNSEAVLPDTDNTGAVAESQTEEIQEDNTEEASEELKDQEEASDNDANEEADDKSDKKDFSFADVSDLEFYFSSGAGGWATSLRIFEDGTFKGGFSDSDMGSTGDGYPNGTVYYCDFDGKFTDPVKIDDYTYEFEIEYLNEKNRGSNEQIEDGILYVFSYAYGLDEAEKMYMYLPGKSTSDFSDDYKMWLYLSDDEKELSYYSLYNKTPEYGFSSYEYKSAYEQMQESIEYTEETAKKYEDSLENDPLSQVELNQTARNIFVCWDDELNMLWGKIKYTLPKDEYDKVLAEQRKWIKEKDAKALEEVADFEGGSMYPMIYDMSLAESTEKRCYELLEYLKEY